MIFSVLNKILENLLFIKFNSKDREIEHGRFNFAMHLYLKPQAYIFLWSILKNR